MLRNPVLARRRRAAAITGSDQRSGALMRTNFVLSTAVSLALLCVATPARAEQGHGARSRGGWVARGTVRTVAASPRMAGRGRQVVIAPRIVTSRAVARVVPRVVVRPRVFVGSPYLFSRPYYSF